MISLDLNRNFKPKLIFEIPITIAQRKTYSPSEFQISDLYLMYTRKIFKNYKIVLILILYYIIFK